MIVEQAVINVTPGSEREFERAVSEARAVISQAPGFRSLRLMRGIEHPDRYLLLNEWDAVEDHMQGFRESELFTRWRELIGPYFAAAPAVEHFEAPVLTG